MVKRLGSHVLRLLGAIPFVGVLFLRYEQVTKFFISGGTAAVVNIGSFTFFTRVMHIWYVYASVAAFVVAFLFSFLMQKYWTFQEQSLSRVRRQLAMHLGVSLVGLSVNTALVYSFVEYVGIHDILSQILSGVIIAIVNFFVYRHIIFVAPVMVVEEH